MRVSNAGSGPAARGLAVAIWASPSGALDSGAVLLGSAVLRQALDPDGAAELDVAWAVPKDLAPGAYHFILAAGSRRSPKVLEVSRTTVRLG